MTRPPYRVVWITGMSRAGSMWLFNVTRDLLREAGLRPLPESPSIDEESSPALARAHLEGGPADAVACLKSHEFLAADWPASRFLVPYRDVRAAASSFMRFMRCDFARALDAAKGMMEATDHYAGFDPAIALMLPYPEIESRPAAVVERVAGFLALPVGAAAARRIAERYAKARVLAIIERTNAGLQAKLDSGAPIGPDEVVPNADGSYRARDAETSFQSNHISGQEDWRQGLAPAQVDALDSLAGDWLARYGLPR